MHYQNGFYCAFLPRMWTKAIKLSWTSEILFGARSCRVIGVNKFYNRLLNLTVRNTVKKVWDEG